MKHFNALSPLAQKASHALLSLGGLSMGNEKLCRELVAAGWCEVVADKVVLTGTAWDALYEERLSRQILVPPPGSRGTFQATLE